MFYDFKFGASKSILPKILIINPYIICNITGNVLENSMDTCRPSLVSIFQRFRMLRPIKYLNPGINGKNLRTFFTSNVPQLEGINIIEDKLHPNVYNVQMNRSENRNTFTIAFWSELKSAFDYLADQAKCRAIVFSANGPVFCAGIDLKDGIKDLVEIMGNETLDSSRKARGIRKLIKHCQDSFSSLERCPKPVIAAVHSHCIGAGISLVSCADIRYASDDAVFSIREVDIGIAADVGILQRIHLISGNDSWARELAFTGKNITAREALKFGFVSRIMDTRYDCLEAAFDLARQIASKSPVAVQGTKIAMNYARSHGVEESLEWMLNWNSSQLQTTDILANVKAKMNKKSGNADGPKFEDI